MKPIDIPQCPNPKVPEPDAPFRHKVDIQVRFGDIDVLGHVNNCAYFAYMDIGKTEYLSRAANAHVEPGGISAVIVNINVNFYSSAYFGEPLSVVTSTSRIGNRSFTLDQRVYNRETGDVKCTARSVLAGFDPVTKTGIAIPEEFGAALRAFEELPVE